MLLKVRAWGCAFVFRPTENILLGKASSAVDFTEIFPKSSLQISSNSFRFRIGAEHKF